MKYSNLVLRYLWPIYAIAINSFREAIRSKVLGSLLGLSLFVMGLGTLMGEMSLHNEVRVATDVGIFLTTLFGVVMGIYASITLLHTEFERRTIYTLLSKPIHRGQFLIGKLLGVSAICATAVLVLGGTSSLLVVIQGGSLNHTFLAAYLMAFLQSLTITALSILFATFTGSLLAGLSAFGVFIAGNLMTQIDMAILHFQEATPPMVPVLRVVRFILPNLEALNLSYELTHATTIPIDYWVTALWYTFSYVSVVMMISVWLFNRKEFQ